MGKNKKELRAEPTVVQTNRLIAASVTHTCAGSDWSQPASMENVTWQRRPSHESKCCVRTHTACCWQATLGKGPFWSTLHGGLLKGLYKVFVVWQRWVSSGMGRSCLPDPQVALADGRAAMRAGRGAAAQGVEGLRGWAWNKCTEQHLPHPPASRSHAVEIAQPFPCTCSLPGCARSTAKM